MLALTDSHSRFRGVLELVRLLDPHTHQAEGHLLEAGRYDMSKMGESYEWVFPQHVTDHEST